MRLDEHKVIIFDLGGTLYEPAGEFCGIIRRFLGEIGIVIEESMTDEALSQIVAESAESWLEEYMLSEGVGQYWEPPREVWVEYDKRFLSALGIEGNLDHLAHEYQKRWDALIHGLTASLLPNVKESLERLQEAGFRLAIASNRFTDPSDYFERDGIADFFETVEYTQIPGYRKPSPYMLLKVASTMKVNPRLCIYVGNIVQYDVVAAERADMTSVLLSWVDAEEVDKAPSTTHISEQIDDFVDAVIG
jgi:HAD superfamily hydrolase (TIGR01549 family)